MDNYVVYSSCLSLLCCLVCSLQSCDHMLPWLSCMLYFLAFPSLSNLYSGSSVVLDCIDS